MVKKLLLFIIIVGVIGSVSYYYIIPALNKPVEVDDISNFSFSYSTGYEMNAYVSYTVECSSDKCIAKVKLNDVEEDEAVYKDVDQAFLDKIKEIITTNHVEKWNGFNKSNKRFSDGNSFSLKVMMKNKQKIEAYGYMKWPNNYGTVLEQFDSLFGSLVH